MRFKEAFAPKAIMAVTEWVWVKPPGYQRPRFFLFGGIVFWLVIGFFVYCWYLFKALLWAALVLAIVVAQLAVWGGQLIAWPFAPLTRRLMRTATMRRADRIVSRPMQ
jgi:hypothetical protein